MLTFKNSRVKNIGKAEVISLVNLEEDRVIEVTGRPFDTYFLVLIYYDSKSPMFLEEIPTGDPRQPTAPSPNELIVTDGDEYWRLARHREISPELIAALETEYTGAIPPDPSIYLVEDDQIPARVQELSIDDKLHILDKIAVYVTKLTEELDGDL